MKKASIDNLKGKICSRIDINEEKTEILFHVDAFDGTALKMYHEFDCCENVRIEDISGDIKNLIGNPILMAEEIKNVNQEYTGTQESHTWTFYKLATIKGYVTLRWLGESNGYYSETVDFAWV